MTTSPPSVRDVLARAKIKPLPSYVARLPANKIGNYRANAILEALAKAGISESQLNSILRGEAVVVTTGLVERIVDTEQTLNRIDEEYPEDGSLARELTVGSIEKRRGVLIEELGAMPQASQESGESE